MPPATVEATFSRPDRASQRVRALTIGGLLPVGVLVATLVQGGCGASDSAIYEGNVRFEHCMALDYRAQIKPSLRRACWREWQRFYTFGQTKDRVEFAQARLIRLEEASDFDDRDWRAESGNEDDVLAVPEPTSAAAPPPMMMAPPPSSAPVAEPAADAGDASTPKSACTIECEEAWNYCRAECSDPACEKVCAGKLKRCSRRC